MAISYVSGSNTTYASRTNTTITAPASIANDDYLILAMVTAAQTEAPDPTAPSGFTQIGSTLDISDGSNFNLEFRIYGKKAASESGNYTVTHSSSSSQGSMLCYRGVDTTTPQDATATGNSGNNTTSTWTGLTTATANAWIVALGVDWADTANNLTPPTGMTERLDVTLTYVSDETIAAAGATGNRTHTNNCAGFQSYWGCYLVALRPAGGNAYTLTASAGSYAITGTAAGTYLGRAVAASAGSYAITGTDAGTYLGRNVSATAGSYAITGTAASLLQTRVVSAAAGSYAVTGTDATLTRNLPMTASAGSYAITGTDAGTYLGRAVAASAGSYAVTGTDASLLQTRLVTAGAGSYAITGTDVGTYLGRAVAAGAGSYAITGTDASTLHGWLVTAGAGSYTVSGTDAALSYASGKTVTASPGSYAIAGTDANTFHAYVAAAGAGSYAMSGVDAGTYLGRAVAAAAGAYSVSGVDAGLLHGWLLDATTAGSYALTGAAATLSKSGTYQISADPGSYAITGFDVDLVYSTGETIAGRIRSSRQEAIRRNREIAKKLKAPKPPQEVEQWEDVAAPIEVDPVPRRFEPTTPFVAVPDAEPVQVEEFDQTELDAQFLEFLRHRKF